MKSDLTDSEAAGHRRLSLTILNLRGLYTAAVPPRNCFLNNWSACQSASWTNRKLASKLSEKPSVYWDNLQSSRATCGLAAQKPE